MVPVPASQRAHSRAWMAEWDLELRLRAVPPPPDIPPEISQGSKPWPAPADPWLGPFPKIGQVRLLGTDLDLTVGAPLYVALISDWEAGLLLAAPFTGFAAPATRGELRLPKRADTPLAVVAPWAAVTVEPWLLFMGSWHVLDLDKDEIEAAWHIFRHAMTGAGIPAELRDRVGAPIVHPLDPRIPYQREMARRMAPVLAQTARILAADATPVEEVAEVALPTAAAERGEEVYPARRFMVLESGVAFELVGIARTVSPFEKMADSAEWWEGRLKLETTVAGIAAAGFETTARLVRPCEQGGRETIAAGRIETLPSGDRLAIVRGRSSDIQRRFDAGVFLLIEP